MKIHWLFTLLMALPAMAAEQADPELAAMEQEFLDRAVVNSMRAVNYMCDLNYNGVCDPNEKPLLMVELSNRYDANGDGQIDLVEWTMGASASSLEETRGQWHEYRRRHPGPLKASELRQAMEEERALASIAGLTDLRRTPGWRERLRTQLLREEDLNHNGILDHEELLRREALDQMLYQIFGQGFLGDFDLDGDGVLSAEERRPVLAALQEDFDLDGDGQVSLNDLQVLGIFANAQSPGALSYPFPRFRQRDLAPFTKEFLPKYDRNGDGCWQVAEMKAAVADNIKPVKLTSQQQVSEKGFIADRDLNGNGEVDPEEYPHLWYCSDPLSGLKFGPDPLDILIGWRLETANPPIPEKVLTSLRTEFSSKRLSQDPRIPEASRASITKDLLALYDSNRDGKLDTEEAWIGSKLESYRAWHLGKHRLPSQLTVEQQQAWQAKLLTIYDKNHNGRWDGAEALTICRQEWVWLVVDEADRQLDKDGDGWLILEERKSKQAEILKVCDFDKNGMVDLREAIEFNHGKSYLQALFRTPATPEQLAEWEQIRDGFYANETGRHLLFEFFQGGTSMMCDTGEKTFQDLRRWRESLLKNYDSNHDGRIDEDEIESHPFWNFSAMLAEIHGVPAEPASGPELQRWALENGDKDGDGRLSHKEVFALLNYQGNLRVQNKAEYLRGLLRLQKLDDKHPSLSEQAHAEWIEDVVWELLPLHPELPRDNAGDVTTAGELALARQLIQEGDRDDDGHLDYAECYRLLRLNRAKAADAKEKARQEKEQRERNHQEAEWMKKYDLNGNGKLDPEERKRAEKETQAGLKSPAKEE